MKFGKKVRRFFRKLLLDEPRYKDWRPTVPEDRAFTTFTMNLNSDKGKNNPAKLGKLLYKLQTSCQALRYRIDTDGTVLVTAESNPAWLMKKIGKSAGNNVSVGNVETGPCSSLLSVPWLKKDAARAPHYNVQSSNVTNFPPYPYPPYHAHQTADYGYFCDNYDHCGGGYNYGGAQPQLGYYAPAATQFYYRS